MANWIVTTLNSREWQDFKTNSTITETIQASVNFHVCLGVTDTCKSFVAIVNEDMSGALLSERSD